MTDFALHCIAWCCIVLHCIALHILYCIVHNTSKSWSAAGQRSEPLQILYTRQMGSKRLKAWQHRKTAGFRRLAYVGSKAFQLYVPSLTRNEHSSSPTPRGGGPWGPKLVILQSIDHITYIAFYLIRKRWTRTAINEVRKLFTCQENDKLKKYLNINNPLITVNNR